MFIRPNQDKTEAFRDAIGELHVLLAKAGIILASDTHHGQRENAVQCIDEAREIIAGVRDGFAPDLEKNEGRVQELAWDAIKSEVESCRKLILSVVSDPGARQTGRTLATVAFSLEAIADTVVIRHVRQDRTNGAKAYTPRQLTYLGRLAEIDANFERPEGAITALGRGEYGEFDQIHGALKRFYGLTDVDIARAIHDLKRGKDPVRQVA